MSKTDDLLEMGRGIIRLAREPNYILSKNLLDMYKSVYMSIKPDEAHPIMCGIFIELSVLIEQTYEHTTNQTSKDDKG